VAKGLAPRIREAVKLCALEMSRKILLRMSMLEIFSGILFAADARWRSAQIARRDNFTCRNRDQSPPSCLTKE
jgi:hypothetical protein